MVLTGGVSALPGIRELAKHILGMPVQVAQPTDLIGMVDQLHSPAFATSVGLLRWAILMSEFVNTFEAHRPRRTRVVPVGNDVDWKKMKDWLRRLLP